MVPGPAPTPETPFFMNLGLIPISIPEFVFVPPSQPETDGSPLIAESSDWLDKQQKALPVAKDSLRATWSTQIINSGKQRQATTFKEGEVVLIHRVSNRHRFPRQALCEAGT